MSRIRYRIRCLLDLCRYMNQSIYLIVKTEHACLRTSTLVHTEGSSNSCSGKSETKRRFSHLSIWTISKSVKTYTSLKNNVLIWRRTPFFGRSWMNYRNAVGKFVVPPRGWRWRITSRHNGCQQRRSVPHMRSASSTTWDISEVSQTFIGTGQREWWGH